MSELINTLLDAKQTLRARQQAAWHLAAIGTDDALAALRRALPTAPAELRATIAEALGTSANAKTLAVLRDLLRDDQDLVVRGAIRGLGSLGDPGAGELLREIVADSGRADGIRTEAALALGGVESADAAPVLIALIGKERNGEVTEALLAGLGRRPISQTQEFFRGYLDSADTDTDFRVAALESLGQATGDVAPLLLKYLGADDADIRAAAAWAIANLEEPGDVSAQLVSRLVHEPEPEVRARLYQALQNQQALDARILGLVRGETDVSARVAGYQLLAQYVGRAADASVSAQFDQIVVPALVELALRGERIDRRLASVIALRQANTPAAIRALADIRVQSRETKIAQAAAIR